MIFDFRALGCIFVVILLIPELFHFVIMFLKPHTFAKPRYTHRGRECGSRIPAIHHAVPGMPAQMAPRFLGERSAPSVCAAQPPCDSTLLTNVKALAAGYDDACAVLHVVDCADPRATIVAKKIIEQSRIGSRSLVALRDLVLIELQSNPETA